MSDVRVKVVKWILTEEEVRRVRVRYSKCGESAKKL